MFQSRLRRRQVNNLSTLAVRTTPLSLFKNIRQQRPAFYSTSVSWYQCSIQRYYLFTGSAIRVVVLSLFCVVGMNAIRLVQMQTKCKPAPRVRSDLRATDLERSGRPITLQRDVGTRLDKQRRWARCLGRRRYFVPASSFVASDRPSQWKGQFPGQQRAEWICVGGVVLGWWGMVTRRENGVRQNG